MNLKNIVYYWAKPPGQEQIAKEGIKVSGGLHMNGVYMAVSPHSYFNRDGRTELFGVDLRGLEKQLLLMPEKKWVISEKDIPKEHIFYVGNNFETLEEVRNSIIQTRNEFLENFEKNHKTLAKGKIRNYNPQKIAQKKNCLLSLIYNN